MVLEGNEFEGKVGEIGSYAVDLTNEGKLRISAGLEIDLIAELKKLAAKTATPIDDQAIAWIELLLVKAKV